MLFVIVLILNFVSTEQIVNPAGYCNKVLEVCLKNQSRSWIRCYEEKMLTCERPRGRHQSHYQRITVNSSAEHLSQVEAKPSLQHIVHIPPVALLRGRAGADKNIIVVASVLNSLLFKPSAPRDSPRGRQAKSDQHVFHGGTVLGGQVLSVTVGYDAINDLTQPVRLIFRHNLNVYNGTCVYWQVTEVESGSGYWSTEGCATSYNETEFTCCCSHLSFFAVLVNPNIKVDQVHAASLSYISFTGSALSVIFTLLSLVIYIFLQRRRPEKSVSIHMQLTAALLCLHATFLVSCLWTWLEEESRWGCQVLGFFLHWSLLATFSWMALEGFHLYFLLVRVFNIYVRRYLLKLCLVGWGVPTVIAVACGISGVYGKYTLQLKDATNQTSTDLCWIKNDEQVVVYIMIAYMGLVLLFNVNMLGVVMFKLWMMRKTTVITSWHEDKHSSRWKMNKVQRARFYKDCATVLGLSCVLGLAWGLAYSTYSSSLLELYLFTVLNSLQGVFMFLWSLALSCKSQSYEMSSSGKDPLMQKTTETSFNN